MKVKLYSILRITISIIAILTLVWLMRDKMGEIFFTLKQTKIWLFILGFLTYLSTLAICSFRLKKILLAQNIPLTLKELIYLTFIGLFFNNFLPTSIGGDVVKAHYASKMTGKRLESFTSIFVDRLMGFFSLVSIASVALIFLGKSIENAACKWIILLMLVGAIVFAFLLLNSVLAKRFSLLLTSLKFFKLDARMKKLYNAINSYKNHKRIVWQTFLLSIGAQAIGIFAIFLLARSLLISTPIRTFFLLMPIVLTVSMLPSINGLGIREGAYVYFFSGIIKKELAFALSLLYLAALLALSIIGGIIYALKGVKAQGLQTQNY